MYFSCYILVWNLWKYNIYHVKKTWKIQLSNYNSEIWNMDSYEYNILHVIHSHVSNTKNIWTWYGFHISKPFDSPYVHLKNECVIHNEMEPTIWIHMNIMFYMLFIRIFLIRKIYEHNTDFMFQNHLIHIIYILKRHMSSTMKWNRHSFSRSI